MANSLEAEAALTSAKGRLTLLLPITHRRDVGELKKAVKSLNCALKILSDLKYEASCVGGVTIRL